MHGVSLLLMTMHMPRLALQIVFAGLIACAGVGFWMGLRGADPRFDINAPPKAGPPSIQASTAVPLDESALAAEQVAAASSAPAETKPKASASDSDADTENNGSPPPPPVDLNSPQPSAPPGQIPAPPPPDTAPKQDPSALY